MSSLLMVAVRSRPMPPFCVETALPRTFTRFCTSRGKKEFNMAKLDPRQDTPTMTKTEAST